MGPGAGFKSGSKVLQAPALLGAFISSLGLFLVLIQGQYQLPGTNLLFQWPSTFLFMALVFGTLYRWTENPKNFAFLKISPGQWLVFLWMIYLVNFRWRGSGDTVAAALEPFALLQHGNLYLTPFFQGDIKGDVSQVYTFQGQIISKYSSAAGLLLTPFYLLTGLAGVAPTDLLCHQLQKMGASFIVALSAYFLLKTLDRLVEHRWALGLTALYALGTAAFSTSSQGIWQHGPSQLFICLGLYWLTDPRLEKKKGWAAPVFWGGLCWAAAVWCRYTDLLMFGAVFAWFVFQRRRQAAIFFLGSLPAFGALALDNYFHSGFLGMTGYGSEQTAFHSSGWAGFLGVLFSPGRGLLVFSPFVIFSFWSLAFLSLKEWRGSYWPFFSLAILADILLYGFWHAWTGGWCYGSRMTADIIPLLVFALYPLVPRLKSSKRLALVFFFWAGFSVILQVIGAFCSWWWEDERANAWFWSDNPIVYLWGHLASPSPRDQFIAGWTVLILLVFLTGWFLRRWMSLSAGPTGKGLSETKI
jgi:hypothetical protein